MRNDWITKTANHIETNARRIKGENSTIVCASGISPSGPIHLGNLREVMTVHLVSEELRSRGWQVDHIHSWDDYDRLRKLPHGVPAEFAQYIGMPLADVPDPFGEYASYVSRYITEFTQGLNQLNIHPRYIHQSAAYRAGKYNAQIKLAMQQRTKIFDSLAKYQTKEDQQTTIDERRQTYYPFRPYCRQCHKDATTITDYDEISAILSYVCQNCGHRETGSLDDQIEGKLVWKVDWPMRWSYEHVDFEPGGEDHSAPGSSYMVGKVIVQEIFQAPPPSFIGYAFVGMGGHSKISSSVGTTATVNTALAIIEPAILRWLYIRYANNQAFDIDFGQGLPRLYDEWDALVRQIDKREANEANKSTFERATQTSNGPVSYTHKLVSFRTLASVLDITQAHEEQTLRIISQQFTDEEPISSSAQLEPRFTCAQNWVTNYLPDDERTHIRAAFHEEAYAALSQIDKESLHIFANQMQEHWDLQGLTNLMYSVPKFVRGLPGDAVADNALKREQRSFFAAIYRLICDSDTGPRIPTLLLAIGQERAKLLLTSGDQPGTPLANGGLSGAGQTASNGQH